MLATIEFLPFVLLSLPFARPLCIDASQAKWSCLHAIVRALNTLNGMFQLYQKPVMTRRLVFLEDGLQRQYPVGKVPIRRNEFIVDTIDEFLPSKICIVGFGHVNAKIITQCIEGQIDPKRMEAKLHVSWILRIDLLLTLDIPSQVRYPPSGGLLMLVIQQDDLQFFHYAHD